MSISRHIAYILLIIVNLSLSDQLAAVGIDYGDEYLKVSTVYPGRSLDIVLTPSGRRKFINSLSLNGEYRLFDTESRQRLHKNPLFTLDSRIPLSEKLNPSYSIKVDNQTTLYWSEVTANMLSHISDQIDSKDKSLVVANSPFWGLASKSVMEEAITLAGYSHLAFIDQAVAAGITLCQSLQKASVVMIYDLGEEGSKVSILSIVPKSKAENTTSHTITELGMAFEPFVGGNYHDTVLRNLIMKKSKDPKLFEYISLGEYKKKLGISDKITVQGIGGNEFVTVTRIEFEKAISPSLDLLKNPIDDALLMANKKLSDIDNIEIIGGSWRVPIVKSHLEKLIKPHTLSIHLNADEAIAIGAGLAAASLSSKSFLNWTEISFYPLQIKCFYDRNKDNKPFYEEEIFPKGSVLISGKTIEIDVKSDFSIAIYDTNTGSTVYDEGFPKFVVSGIKTTVSPDSSALKDSKDGATKDLTKDAANDKASKEASNDGKKAPNENFLTSDAATNEKTTNEKFLTRDAATNEASNDNLSMHRVRITIKRDSKGVKLSCELLNPPSKPTSLRVKQLDALQSKIYLSRKERLLNYIKRDKEYNNRIMAHSNLESAVYESYSLSQPSQLALDGSIKGYYKLDLVHFISDSERKALKDTAQTIESWLELNGQTAKLEELQERMKQLGSLLATPKSRQIAFDKWVGLILLLKNESDPEILAVYQKLVSDNPSDYGVLADSFSNWLDNYFKERVSKGVSGLSTSDLMNLTAKLKGFTEARSEKLREIALKAKEAKEAEAAKEATNEAKAANETDKGKTNEKQQESEKHTEL